MSPNNPVNEKSLGAWLREVRDAKNLSLEQVSKGTRIHVNVLQSLESDDVKGLGAVYVKSFLKLYAEYLGLDKEEVVRRYEQSSGGSVPARERIVFPGQAKTTPRGVSMAGESFRFVVAALKQLPWKQILIGVACLAVVLLIGRAIKNHKATHPPKKKAVIEKPVKSQTTRTAPTALRVPPRTPVVEPAAARTAVAPAPTKEPLVSPATEKVKDKVVLIVKAKEKTWIQVKVDGKTVFQSSLAKGTAERWQAQEQINLWIGNAGAVQLELNGRLFERIGRPGQTLKNVVVTRSGLSIKR